MACSWAGLAYECSRQTAMASTPSATSCSTAALGLRHVERPDDRPVVVDALVHLEAQRALDQRARLVPGQVVQLGHAQAAELEDVAEAARS